MNKFTLFAVRTFQFVAVVLFIAALIYFFEGPRQGPSWLRQAENQISTANEFKDMKRLVCSADINTVKENVLNCQASFQNGTSNEFDYVANTRLNTNMVNFEVFRERPNHLFLYIRPIERAGQNSKEQLSDYVALMKDIAVRANKETARVPVSLNDYFSAQFAVNNNYLKSGD